FTVTANTTQIDGLGGNDTVVFEVSPSSRFDWFRITPTADGGLDVKDVHATGQVVHLNNVETLVFNNGSYDVASATFTAGSATAPQSAQIMAPQVAQASAPGDIVGLVVRNNAATSEAPGIVTFGEIFAPGAVMPGTQLVAKIGGQTETVQMDVR